MEQQEETRGNARFGAYLKRVREDRRLSLDAVEELSAGFPEKVTKSHLSRIENGLALPTFPRLMAMSHIYGVPIASLAERYEIDLRRGMTPIDLGGKSEDEILKDVATLRLAGNYHEALVRLLSLIDERYGDEASATREQLAKLIDLRVLVANCLKSLGRFEVSKSMCEQLLSSPGLTHENKLGTILVFAICCYRLGRYTVAMMALDQVADEIENPLTPKYVAADLEFIRGNLYLAMAAPQNALVHLEHARALYDSNNDSLESCRAGLVLAESLIELERFDEGDAELHRVLARADQAGFDRMRALALSNLAVSSFKRGDGTTAESMALRSNAVARPIEYHEIVFRNCFYLWEIAKQRGDASATKLNERTLRSYVGRIESKFPEAERFRNFVGRGQP